MFNKKNPRYSPFGHMFTSTSLVRLLGKKYLAFLIYSTSGSVQLGCLGMQYPLHPGGIFGPLVDDGQKPFISRLRNGKGSNEQGKGTSSSDGIKPVCDCTGIVKCHIVPYLHYSISCFSVTIE